MKKNSINNLLRKLIDQNPDILYNPNGFLKHSLTSYDLAEKIIREVKQKYPEIPLIQEEICTASGLHDIGRLLKKEQLFHELRSADYIEKCGVKNKITLTQKESVRIAQMVRSHGAVYECWTDYSLNKLKEEFREIDSTLLIPRTWQESIVCFIDMANLNGYIVSLERKMKEAMKRYKNYSKMEYENCSRLLKRAEPRLKLVEQRVNKLRKGQFSKSEIYKYGFI